MDKDTSIRCYCYILCKKGGNLEPEGSGGGRRG